MNTLYIFRIKIVLFVLSVFFIFPKLEAQVTIGSNLAPLTGALLDLKEYSSDSDKATSTKGLGLPRVNLTEKQELYPMFLQNDGVTPTDEYANKKGTIDGSHMGLLVFNLNTTTTFCPGLYVWNGNEWRPYRNQKTVEDIEGNVYRVGDFGSAGKWMVDNLRTKTYSDGTSLNAEFPTAIDSKSYAYPNNEPEQLQYGLLYTWAATMNGSTASDEFKDTDINNYGTMKSTTQGICPTGWVVPSDYDWTLLEEEIANFPTKYSTSSATPWNTDWASMANIYESGNQKNRGDFDKNMKSAEEVNDAATNGTSKLSCNEGFNIPMAGCIHTISGAPSIDHFGTQSYHWTSTSYGTIFRWFRSMNNTTSNGVNRYFRSISQYQMSVRCKQLGS